MSESDRRIGFTSTIPVEAVLAAGLVPVDLNNAFIAHPERDDLLSSAERAGFPATVCAWIKGIFAVLERERIGACIAVTNGDCSNTVALAEVLEDRGMRTIRFGYPQERSRYEVEAAIAPLLSSLYISYESAQAEWEKLKPLRAKLAELDALTWYTDKVTGEENHSWLVSGSDFRGDPATFERHLDRFLATARAREPLPVAVRLGVAGVPTIYDDLYPFLESLGARVVFNEVQRQFAMTVKAADLIDQYRRYTYPYAFSARLTDIAEEVRRRRCAGLIHYVQSFCHRGIEDILLRKHAGVPVLTLQGDRPGPLDGRTRVRVEAFVEMLSRGTA